MNKRELLEFDYRRQACVLLGKEDATDMEIVMGLVQLMRDCRRQCERHGKDVNSKILRKMLSGIREAVRNPFAREMLEEELQRLDQSSKGSRRRRGK